MVRRGLGGKSAMGGKRTLVLLIGEPREHVKSRYGTKVVV
jgi:hypothetical protein